MRIALTDIAIRRLQSPEKGQLKVWDTNLPGFGLIVGKRTKTFTVMVGTDRRTKAIGRYPDMSLKSARERAKQLMATPNALSIHTTLSDALSAYYEDCAGRLRPGSLVEYQRHLNRLPDKPLAQFTAKDVDSADAHAVNAIKVFFNWCLRHELVARNPFLSIPIKYGQRSRVLSPAEIKAVWAYDRPPYSDIVKLLLLTGQRRGEIHALQPDWIQGDTVTTPAEVTKNGKGHTYPIGPLAMRYLENAPFSFNGWGRAQKRMHQHTGVTDWVLHDLRRTCATIHVEIGTPVHVTEAILNHSSGSISGVAAVYIRANLLAEMRKAALQYEAHIVTLVDAPRETS